jgi:hypothetical protein
MSRIVAVTRGLDPRVHLKKLMDCRVKPGNDAVYRLANSTLSGIRT